MSAQTATTNTDKILVIACGALAPELTRLKEVNNWHFLDFKCLPAEYHNFPDKILPAIQQLVQTHADHYQQIFIGYSDCGTGGQLDRYIEQQGFARLPGMHCYEMFAGSEAFLTLHERELGTFYLTDYLARNFQRLIIEGMGIDKYPELESMYFGAYKKLVYLAQTNNAELDACAEQAAKRLGLSYERIFTGMEKMQHAISVQIGQGKVNHKQYEHTQRVE